MAAIVISLWTALRQYFITFKPLVMSAKTTNILYWVATVLFAAAMLSSGIMGMQPTADNQAVMHQLGYPM